MAYVFEGVKIECTNGRFINTEFDREAGVLVIKEFFEMPAAIANMLSPIQHIDTNNTEVHHIKLPVEFLSKRVIGRPLCIGCKENVFLFQYTIDESRYVCFFIADLASDFAYLCEDPEHFFSRDLLTVGSLEGIVCSDERMILIRLPQDVLSSHKWSKVMQIDFKPNTFGREALDETYDSGVASVISSCLQDRRRLAISAHPLKPNLVFTALVDEFCFKCKFLVRNIKSKQIELEKRHRIIQPTCVTRNLTYDPWSEPECEPGYYCQLLWTSLVMSRDGNVVILVYVASTGSQEYCLVFMYDTQTLRPICNHTAKVVASPLLKPGRCVLSTMISPNDEYFCVCLFKRGTDVYKTLCSFKIPREPNLKRQCREVILKMTRTTDLHLLHLPKQLIGFLKFQKL